MSVNVDLTAEIEVLVPLEGTQLLPDDIGKSVATGSVGLAALIDNHLGRLFSAIGLTNALPATNPVQIALTGGLGISLAGSPEWLIAQGRILDTCPVFTDTLAPANATNPRIDLIAVQATRVAGTTNVNRIVRSDTAPVQVNHLMATLVGGSATLALPAGFTSVPVVDGIAPLGGGSTGSVRPTAISTSSVTLTSTDAADTRVVNFQVYGTPTGSLGISTAIVLYENQPAWQLVTGTPGAVPAVPATPAGYEAFATIAVAANQVTLVSGNIKYLFVQAGSIANKRRGIISGIPSDGSAEGTITWSPALPSAPAGVKCTIINAGAGVSLLSAPQVDASTITAGGCQVYVTGGAPGSTCSIYFETEV
jgi:hypothetical protein